MNEFKKSPLKIGIAGPVGSGKTALIEALTQQLKNELAIGIVTNDIYTQEDANYLRQQLPLDDDRIIGVETGGCPHTAIRDDISMNQQAVEQLCEQPLDIIFVESGGDNLSATFSYELVDYYLYVIDVAQGADIPRKKGIGLLQCDLLVVNKTDLAPYVGVDLPQMEIDVQTARGNKPYMFVSQNHPETLSKLANFMQACSLN